MKKMLKIINCICLSGMVLLSATNNADAFFMKPPMPWDLEIDLPGNAGKLVSEAKALVMQAKTIKSQLNTLTLDSIAGNLKSTLKNTITKEMKSKKDSNKGIVTGNIAGTELSADTSDEKDYFDVFHKLFFMYPSSKNYEKIYANATKYGKEGYQLIQSLYKKNGVKYREDVVVDTYFKGLQTERYLLLVEKTLERLEKCQNNIEKENCSFFGLTMEEIPSVENPEELGENNPGLLAQMKNAYVVSTVYDRLMQIVEELVAIEAKYQSAKQIELVRPVSTDESNAEKYISQKYNFASKDVEEKVYAKSLLIDKKQSECFNGGEGCQKYNSEQAELKNMDDAAIMKDIAPIAEALNQARDFHNQKTQMPTYKTKYRQYLIAKIIHERANKALIESEKCASTFFEEYKNKDKDEETKLIWGTPAVNNEHEKRPEGSLSRWLINEYGRRTMNKIIGTDPDCDGYYESCPQGYVQKEDEHCIVLDENKNIVRERNDLHPCIVETIADDQDIPTSDDEQNPDEQNPIEDMNNKKGIADDNNGTYSDGDFLKDVSDTNDLNIGSRITTETPWQLGSELLMKLVSSKDMVFKPWNDQKSFQEEYLRQKYRNIKLIIKSIDRAVNSYQIAATQANAGSPLYEERDKNTSEDLSKMMNAIASCLSIPEAIEEATKEFCTGTEEEESCTVYVSKKNPGRIIGKREVKYIDTDGEEKIKTEPLQKWDQRISLNNTCYFKAEYEPRDLEIKDKNTNKCGGNGWDLSVGYLVRSYYNNYLGKCAGSIEAKAKELYEYAKNPEKEKNPKGRIVAQDILGKVIEARTTQNKEMQKWIEDREKEIASLKNKMEEDKLKINYYNEELDKAAQKKNIAQNALALSEQRVKSIDAELAQLDRREEAKEKTDKDEYNACSFEYQKMKLQYERAEICAHAVDNRACGEDKKWDPQWTCPQSCKEAEKEKGMEICQKVADSHLIRMSTYEIYLAKESQKDSPINVAVDSTKFVNITEAKEIIDQQKLLIDSKKNERNIIKDEIAKLENEIREKTDEFADDYIKVATKSQEALRISNEEFEDFLKEEGNEQIKRMENSKRQSCKRTPPLIGKKHCDNTVFKNDNLKTTITQILANNDTLKEVVKEQINEGIIKNISSDIIAKALQDNLGVSIPAEFVVDETVKNLEILEGINPGVLTAIELVNKVKEVIVNAASDIVTEQITNADNAVEAAQEKAIAEVEKISRDLGICEACIASPEQKENLSNQEYHEGTVLPMHKQLIDNLNKISKDLGIPNIFGIPEGSADIEDEEYFVGLPARGNNYINKTVDENAGRDYLLPKEPLISLPPVREVFYYSAQDYEDTPKAEKKKKQTYYKPVISYLLNKKYTSITDPYAKDWEYLPEIWRYLLARPNLRVDRKYQQTFVERSFDTSKLNNILGKSEDYRTIIARGGTYPCKLGGLTIDVVGTADGSTKDIRKIKFVKRDKKPDKLKQLQSCWDINSYNQRPCNTYETRGTICHMLSNHGPKDNGKKEKGKYKLYEDYQSIGDTGSEGMFSTYSELGTLLQDELKYRPMQQWVNEYLLSEDNSYMENDIHRQKAEHAAFTHNIWGSFLETVNAEYNARKSLEKITEEVRTSFENLCEVIHNQKVPEKDKDGKIIKESRIEITGEDPIPDDCDEACLKEHNEQCTDILFKNFAKSAEDKNYGMKGEYTDDTYNKVNCNGEIYESIFCLFDNLKKQSLSKAIKGEEDQKGKGGIDALNKNYETAEKNRVKEYLISLMKERAALEADENEVTYIPADLDVDIPIDSMENLVDVYKKIENMVDDNMKNNIKTAKTNRTIARENDDLAISSMENQNQVVPYCPFYIYKDNSGL